MAGSHIFHTHLYAHVVLEVDPGGMRGVLGSSSSSSKDRSLDMMGDGGGGGSMKGICSQNRRMDSRMAVVVDDA